MSAHRDGEDRGGPAHGVRFEITRGEAGVAPAEIVYRGVARLEGATFDAEVRVTRDAASARITGGGLAGERIASLEKALAALVRAATRAPLAEGRLPPRRIVRWRALD